MNILNLLRMLNGLLPAAISLYREIRAAAGPGAASLTDEQIIELLRVDSEKVVSTAEAWLAEHPANEPDPL